MLLANYATAQISIPDVGDGWKVKIDSALSVIKNYDTPKYNLVIKECKRIDFWNGSFATTDDNTIVIPTSELKAGIVNDLAAIIVHESLHLYYAQHNIRASTRIHSNVSQEEADCYFYEFDFLSKIPNIQPWLLQNAYKQYLKFKL